MARPLKLNETMTVTKVNRDGTKREEKMTRGDRLIEMVRGGNYYDDAARISGLGPATFYAYMAQGREDRKRGKSTPMSEFLDSVEKAAAESDAEDIAAIKIAGANPQHWQARAWRLERRHPERWGQRSRVMIETAVKQEMAEEFVQFIAGVLERRVTDPNARVAIINDLLEWSTQRSAVEVGEPVSAA